VGVLDKMNYKEEKLAKAREKGNEEYNDSLALAQDMFNRFESRFKKILNGPDFKACIFFDESSLFHKVHGSGYFHCFVNELQMLVRKTNPGIPFSLKIITDDAPFPSSINITIKRYWWQFWIK
jgi:hypothetical protein